MSGLDSKTSHTVLSTPKDFLSWKVDLRVHLNQWDDDNDKALVEIMPTLGPAYKAHYQTVDQLGIHNRLSMFGTNFTLQTVVKYMTMRPLTTCVVLMRCVNNESSSYLVT
jgi:hypothetical protein